MAEVYSSLKVTITGLGDHKYLSLLESDLPSVGGGRGHELTLDPEAPAGAGAPKLSEFLKNLATGAMRPGDVERFGKSLFDQVFGGQHAASYGTAIRLTQSMKRRLRICMNVLAPELVDVPWEYLHDGSGFVIKRGPAIVRLLEGVTAIGSSFTPVQNMLIAVADPVNLPDEFVPFGGEAHLAEIRRILGDIGGLRTTPLLRPDPDAISRAFHENEFDAFYFIGHGVHLESGGGHLVCERDGNPVYLPADDLAAWTRESTLLRFVYLNSCSTAVTSAANPMQGVAQRLMQDGHVSAVVAMQSDVKQTAAQRIAKRFFEELVKGRSAEDAMLVSRTNAGDQYSFGVPVLYSTHDAPAQFEKNRLAALLSLKEDSTCALLLPHWIMGLPGKAGEEANRKGLGGDQYYYRGPTFATADVNSAWSITDLMGRVLPADHIQIRSNDDIEHAATSHKFVFGSQSSTILRGVLELFQPEFEFDYKPKDAPGHWVIRDTKFGNCYEIHEPHHLDYDEFEATTDYGVIQKFSDTESGRVYFLIAGLGSRATEGCGYFLRDHWSDLLREFGSKDFGIVVMFPKNLGPHEGKRVKRETGTNPCSEIAQRTAHTDHKPARGGSEADAARST